MAAGTEQGRPVPLPPAVTAWLAEEDALVAQGALNRDCKTRLYDHLAKPVRGIVLMLHGFTAGPWQYDELGALLAQDGLMGLAVRLVGHGATRPDRGGVSESHADMPRAAEVNRFIAWAERALGAAQALARAHNVPLYLVGLSAGGAMALDILRNPSADIARAVLLAPLLKPKQLWLRAFVRGFGALPYGNRLADRWGLSWKKAPLRSDGWQRPGHQQFALGNVMALFRYARAVNVAADAPLRAPMQIIATAIDDKVSLPACRALARRDSGRHSLHVFEKAQQVPHAMLTRWEHPSDARRQEIFRIVRDFLLDGRASRRD